MCMYNSVGNINQNEVVCVFYAQITLLHLYCEHKLFYHNQELNPGSENTNIQNTE